MQIGLALRAIIFAGLIGCQPARAEWKETLVRSITPILFNRGIDYLLKNKHQSRNAQSGNRPQSNIATKGAANKAVTNRPAQQRATTTTTMPPPSQLPPPPVITAEEMQPLTALNASQVKPVAVPKKGQLAIPPPPKLMVPPPPPGIPTGAILGFYPSESPAIPDSQAISSPPDTPVPMPAPDFRIGR